MSGLTTLQGGSTLPPVNVRTCRGPPGDVAYTKSVHLQMQEKHTAGLLPGKVGIVAIRTDEEAEKELEHLRWLVGEYENMGMHHSARHTLDHLLYETLMRRITILEKGAPF